LTLQINQMKMVLGSTTPDDYLFHLMRPSILQTLSLIEFAEWMVSLNETDNHQEWLNQAPFSFDLSVMAIYPCLTFNETIHSANSIKLAYSICTPLGSPVEPEVNIVLRV
jgi:hypothetical protein